nr:ECF subfamily RNA polymerase sigma factor, BldN family [Catenulispora rubra]
MYRDNFGLNGYSTKVGGDPFAGTGALSTQVLSTHVPMPVPAPLLDRQERGLLMLREAIRVVAGEGGGRGAHAAGTRSGGARHGGGSGSGAADRPGGPVAGDGESEAMVHLVHQAQEGSADAFGELYRIYCDTVFRYIYYRVSTRALAEDLTSETFVRALRRITTFSWQGRDFGAWLVTIARNLVADHFKSSRHRMEVSTGEMLDSNEVEASPEDSVLEHLSNEALLDAVHRLNDQQRECVTLRFLQGLSVAETADIMGKNEGAIKTLQYRAVRTLARLLPAEAL